MVSTHFMSEVLVTPGEKNEFNQPQPVEGTVRLTFKILPS